MEAHRFEDDIFGEDRGVVGRPFGLRSIPLAISIVVAHGPCRQMFKPNAVSGVAWPMPDHLSDLERSMYSGPREYVSPDVLPLEPEVGVASRAEGACPQVTFTRAINGSLEPFVS
jgi:hypothetical protein